MRRRMKACLLLSIALLVAGCGQTGPLIPAETMPIARDENADPGADGREDSDAAERESGPDER
jgi:predicted small lipoprotein YifL